MSHHTIDEEKNFPTSPSPKLVHDRRPSMVKERSTVVVEGVIVQDAVFGDINDEGSPDYRSLGWIRTTVLLIKVQIGLGVLGIPSVLISVGLVPGLILILFIGALTTWCNWVVGTFKLRHPEVYSMADVGYLIGGPVLREVFGTFYFLMLTSVAGAGMLGIATAFKSMTEGRSQPCSVVFVLVGAILCFACSSFRTLGRIAWIGWAGLTGIMVAVLTLAIAVGVQDRPSDAPQVGPWSPQTINFGTPTFMEAMTAVSTIIFSFAGAPNFVNIVAEMREPRDFTKALLCCQAVVTGTYAIIGCVVYHYVGVYVSSPALGSAGILLKKICYGIALPGLVAGMVLSTHLPAKYVFLRVMKRSKHLNSSSWQHWAVWLSCVGGCTLFSFIIAEAIPFFGDLVGLIGALLGAFLSLVIEGVMYIWDNRHRLKTDKSIGFRLLLLLAGFCIAAGSFCMIAGTVASVMAIHKTLQSGNTTAPFSCGR